MLELFFWNNRGRILSINGKPGMVSVWLSYGRYFRYSTTVFSRFRITVNGGQCISCGNCSTYCEMGIDVRAYAQKGENIVRASCVGCGICAEVCPRGVLKLENGPLSIEDGKIRF